MGRAIRIRGGDVRCMDRARTCVESIAWQDGRILALGNMAEVARAAPDAREIDAEGATVLPGLIDAHHHASVATLYGGRLRLAAPAVTDIANLQAKLSEAANALAPDRWLVAIDWDEMRLAERRPPTRAELDDAVPDHPLFALHYTCHRGLANSRALELAGIDRHTPEPSGGTIVRGAKGLPTGLLIERGMSRVEMLARADLATHDADGFFERLAAHHRALVAVGITRIADAAVPPDLVSLYHEAERRGVLLVPTLMMPVSRGGWLEAPWDVIETTPSLPSALLSIGPVKLVFDGAPACSMCVGIWQSVSALATLWSMALKRRSLDPIRTSAELSPRLRSDLRLASGIAIYGRDEAHEVVRAIVDGGFAVATHAIGNEAIDVALGAYERARGTLDRGGVPRLEHAWFLSRDLVSRIAGVGAAVVTQPGFLTLPAYSNVPRISGLRGAPLRWLLDAGVAVAGSSDFPVATFAPLEGIRCAVSRLTTAGHAYEPDQAIELDEALEMYTRTAALVCGCLDACGTLEVGKRADLVLLDRKIASDLANASVRATVIGGEVVYGEIN